MTLTWAAAKSSGRIQAEAAVDVQASPAIMRKYADQTSLNRAVHPHLLGHQILTFLIEQGLTEAKIQLISGHGNRKVWSN